MVQVKTPELSPRIVSVVFLMDQPGVLQYAPTTNAAKRPPLIPLIEVDHRGRFINDLPGTTTAAHDVTGGIMGKLRAAAAIAAKGVQVIIAEVGTEHAANALAGKVPEVCTVIKLRHNTDV
eukprot:INCI3243.4.p2 GENE.INCI3243.4~~INCI3243.4.p2  ORF type:complete len:121 (-),score=13.54 INCI3243.4:676-1038(-)